jgi:type VI secretion system secreted protein Hcp
MAFHSYVSFKGSKQGQLKGESLKGSRSKEWSEVESFEMRSAVPVDSKSGYAKGARTHFPLVITKERGASSPQLLQALWTSELLTTVVLEVIGRPESGAGEVVVERTTLTNATISEIRRFVDLPSGEHAEHDNDVLESVHLVFQQILVENPIASTSATESWTTTDK